MAANILIVDDEQAIADLVEVYLKNENFNVFKFYNEQDTLNSIDNEKYDLAILDVMLPDIDGFQFAGKSGTSIISDYYADCQRRRNR